MTERPKPGEAMALAERRWKNLTNARRNEIARKGLVYHGEYTAEENLAIQRELKAAFLARHPEMAA